MLSANESRFRVIDAKHAKSVAFESQGTVMHVLPVLSCLWLANRLFLGNKGYMRLMISSKPGIEHSTR
jgi:hypothetical protein